MTVTFPDHPWPLRQSWDSRGNSQQAEQESVFQAACSARSMARTCHCKFTSGHAWMPQLAGVRTTTSLVLQTAGHTVDLLAAAGSLKASTSAALNGIISLFHVAVHSVDLRQVASGLPGPWSCCDGCPGIGFRV